MYATTTIAVTMDVKEKLRILGNKGDSYNVIIQKLIEKAALKERDKRWNRILEEDTFISLDEL